MSLIISTTRLTHSNMKLNKLVIMTALSAALVGSVSYATSNDALLDLLVKKGVLTDSEATAVAAELKEENKGVDDLDHQSMD